MPDASFVELHALITGKRQAFQENVQWSGSEGVPVRMLDQTEQPCGFQDCMRNQARHGECVLWRFFIYGLPYHDK